MITKMIPAESHINNTKQFTQSKSIPAESHISRQNNSHNQNRFQRNHIFLATKQFIQSKSIPAESNIYSQNHVIY